MTSWIPLKPLNRNQNERSFGLSKRKLKIISEEKSHTDGAILEKIIKIISQAHKLYCFELFVDRLDGCQLKLGHQLKGNKMQI